MGERKGQNKYYPPDFDWRKHSSLNAYQGVHALRERARKLDRGILIIRFEMPYNIWCNTCGNHIGMGVRYNAEKTKIGNYFTTPIFQFRMKCHLCDGHFEIKTDPKARDYVIVSGARREEQRWDAADNGQVVMQSTEEMKKLATDAMFKLEYEGKDVAKKSNKSAPDLTELEMHQSAWKDDYIINYVLRKNLREAKREDRLQKEADDRVRQRASIDIPLLPSNRQDDRLAKLYRLESVRTAEQAENDRREAIHQQQVLKGTSNTSSEINWTPATFISNKKQASSTLGIVRKSDKLSSKSETKNLMSSNASSSGIESDTDSSPNIREERDQQTIVDMNNSHDEGFIENKDSIVMLDTKKQRPSHVVLPHQSIQSNTSKSTIYKSCHYPYSTRNPYDDDTTSSSVVEDWDEECQVIEPYHFPSYIRRAQWPNHWRWTPPLGIRRTCTQQLHRNFGFERTNLYDDVDSFSSNINFRHIRFDL